MGPAAQQYSRSDFDHSPLLVFYETTQACDLLCKHCRAVAQPCRNPLELSNADARKLIESLMGFAKPPHLVFTGGDPLKREDIFELVAYATTVGLRAAMTPSATPLVTRPVLQKLKDCGLKALAISLDGADAATHDDFRQVPGSFERTLAIARWAGEVGLPLQINTTITRHNLSQIDAIADRVAEMGIVLWSVFFLIPVGRASAQQRITAEEFEGVFERLYQQSLRQVYAIKTTEAPHYRRFLQQRRKEQSELGKQGTAAGRMPMVGTNDGKGILFVSHTGEIYPSGFLPLRSGRFPKDSVVEVYTNSPVFRSLREPDGFAGKCGVCEFRNICGGSRSRAHALTGEATGSDPDCGYQPVKWRQEAVADVKG